MKKKEKLILGVLIALIIIGCCTAIILINKKVNQRESQSTLFSVKINGLKTFSSLDEIKSLLDKYQKSSRPGLFGYFSKELETGSVATVQKIAQDNQPVTASSSISYSTTNVRTEGIDEPDIFKNDGKYFYYLINPRTIKIVQAYPPKDMKIVKTIDLSEIIDNLTKNKTYVIVNIVGKEEKYPIKLYVYISKLYVTNKYLIIIASTSDRYLLFPITWILVFNKDSWKLERYYWVSGIFKDARLKDNIIYLVTYIPTYIIRPIIVPLTKDGKVPVNHIGYIENEKPEIYINVIAYEIDTGKANVLSILGLWPSILYMTSTGNIYLVFNYYYYYSENFAIVKIHADKLKLEVINTVTIKGRIPHVFAIDEYKGYLRVAVNTRKTIFKYPLYSSVEEVDLYIFDEKLNLVSKLNITINERIHGARFMGNRLYIVTYRQIDPLFTIDLSDPKHPKIIGYLEGPGFDEYLHPISNEMLIGIGRSEKWKVRITTYKITEKGVKKIDSVELPYFYTPIFNLEGYRAFVINKKEKYILLPVSSAIAVIYYDEEGHISVKGFVAVNDPQRAAYIDNVCYGVGKEIIAFNCSTLKKINKIKLSDVEPYYFVY